MSHALNPSDNPPPAPTAAEYFLHPGRRGKLARRDHGGFTVNLTYGKKFWDLPAYRSTLFLTLLLALKDRASEVRFERLDKEAVEGGFRMAYRIDGEWYELVPPPAMVGALMVRELKTLAGRHSWRARLGGFLRSLAERIDRQIQSPASGRIHVRVTSHTFVLTATVDPTSPVDRVFLRFPEVDPEVSDEAQAQLCAVFSGCETRGWVFGTEVPENAAPVSVSDKPSEPTRE